jgi:hypothetical protein
VSSLMEYMLMCIKHKHCRIWKKKDANIFCVVERFLLESERETDNFG